MLISPDYLGLQKTLHAGGRYGISSGRWAETIRGLSEREECSGILDYGCGQGQLKVALGDCVREYDPAIAGRDQEPEPADLVVCTDVLEHIEPECLDDVLLHLRSKVKKRLFFAISLRPAGKTLADGRNAHLIVESADWWTERLAPYFRVLDTLSTGRREFAGIARSVSIVGAIKSVGVMKNERNGHTRQNVLKTAKRIPDQPLPPHERVALIACYTIQTDYDTSEPAVNVVSVQTGGTQWNAAQWDSFQWAGGAVPSLGWQGVTGEGRAASIAFGVSSREELTYDGADIGFERGTYV